jgi:septal ring factor EnvC (AmiA/AmiB activator)
MSPAPSPRVVILRPAVAAIAGSLLLGWVAASAQTPRPAPPQIRPAASPSRESPNLEGLQQREKELESLRAEQKRILDNEAKLKREIESIGDDRRKFNQQLIDTAARVTGVEQRVDKTQERLNLYDESQEGLQKSLEERRQAIAEVLAALQRIGRHAPPALIMPAEDALQSVRSAMMLGAVLPEMRQQTESLVNDLGELVNLRKQIAYERDKLARDLFIMADERQRLSLLIEERQKKQLEVEKSLAEERQRAAALARQAADVKDLIAKLEQGLDSVARASRQALRSGDDKKAINLRPDLAALKDPGRLVPAIAFASAKRMLPLPVNGVKIKDFGTPDGMGGTEKGLSLAARPGSQITAPCDGWVVYSGTFRNYGQLLILNAGGGYHVLLAGMERTSVDLGQFVVTGEPVAVMGGGAQSAVPLMLGSSQPVLYVEFRKDGVPVDPGPWWAASEGEKVRG